MTDIDRLIELSHSLPSRYTFHYIVTISKGVASYTITLMYDNKPIGKVAQATKHVSFWTLEAKAQNVVEIVNAGFSVS